MQDDPYRLSEADRQRVLARNRKRNQRARDKQRKMQVSPEVYQHENMIIKVLRFVWKGIL